MHLPLPSTYSAECLNHDHCQSTGAITDIVPQITYAGDYPTAPLDDTSHGGFNVDVRVHTWAAQPTEASITIVGGWSAQPALTKKIQIPAGNALLVPIY